MVWVECSKCNLKDTCKYYAQMKDESLKTSEQICAKGCK